MIRVSENTMRWLRHTGAAPPAAKVGRRLVFKERDVADWIDAQFRADAGGDVTT